MSKDTFKGTNIAVVQKKLNKLIISELKIFLLQGIFELLVTQVYPLCQSLTEADH